MSAMNGVTPGAVDQRILNLAVGLDEMRRQVVALHALVTALVESVDPVHGGDDLGGAAGLAGTRQILDDAATALARGRALLAQAIGERVLAQRDGG